MFDSLSEVPQMASVLIYLAMTQAHHRRHMRDFSNRSFARCQKACFSSSKLQHAFRDFVREEGCNVVYRRFFSSVVTVLSNQSYLIRCEFWKWLPTREINEWGKSLILTKTEVTDVARHTRHLLGNPSSTEHWSWPVNGRRKKRGRLQFLQTKERKMNTSSWQHPFVNIFKHFDVGSTKKCAKQGDVTALMVRQSSRRSSYALYLCRML